MWRYQVKSNQVRNLLLEHKHTHQANCLTQSTKVADINLAWNLACRQKQRHCWGKDRNVTAARWQVTLCDPIWYASSCSDEAVSLTAVLHLLTLPTYYAEQDLCICQLSVCSSQHGPTATKPLLQVCCCGPAGRRYQSIAGRCAAVVISILYFTCRDLHRDKQTDRRRKQCVVRQILHA